MKYLPHVVVMLGVAVVVFLIHIEPLVVQHAPSLTTLHSVPVVPHLPPAVVHVPEQIDTSLTSLVEESIGNYSEQVLNDDCLVTSQVQIIIPSIPSAPWTLQAMGSD